MNNYIGKTLICDMNQADGNVKFEENRFDFYPRGSLSSTLSINYADIVDIKLSKGIKSTVAVVTNTEVHYFYLYKANTLIDALNKGRNINSSKSDEPLTNDQIEKLSKLAELKEKGVLTEEEFLKQKELILNK